MRELRNNKKMRPMDAYDLSMTNIIDKRCLTRFISKRPSASPLSIPVWFTLLKELKALLEKTLGYYPPEEQEALLMVRRRPRRQGKPL